MNWYKVTFTPPEDERYETMQFAEQIRSVLIDTFPNGTLPQDFGIFLGIETDGTGNQAIYFSPVAVQFCNYLIASRNGQPCQRPQLLPGTTVIQGDLRILSENPEQ